MAYRSNRNNYQDRSSFRERDQDRSSFREHEDSDGYNIRNMAGRDNGYDERSKPYDKGLAPDELDSSEWVHDRYQDDDSRPYRKRENFKPLESYRPAPPPKPEGIQITIRNLPYNVTPGVLEELCERFGDPTDINLVYDRTDRSTGIAHVTYKDYEAAKLAVREIDGAKAYGQVVYASMRPPPPKRSLFDRIEHPVPEKRERRSSLDRGNSRRQNGSDKDNNGDRGRPALDRYVPPHRGSRDRNSRDRESATLRPRNGGNRIDRKQGRNDRDRGGRRGARTERPKKTQESLDQELEAYFNQGQEQVGGAEQVPVAEVAPADFGGNDIDMELEI